MKKVWRAIAGTAVMLVLFMLSSLFLKYLLLDNADSYARTSMHEFYNSEENIDVLFLGSSHCNISVDPRIVDKELRCYSFNAGSLGQELDSSYALLVEADKNNDLKTVYIDLYYEILCREPKEKRTELTPIYVFSDYMKLSVNKLQLLLGASTSDYYVNSLLPERRKAKKLFDIEYMETNIMQKQREAYRNFEVNANEKETYIGKGFLYLHDTMDGAPLYWDKNIYQPFEKSRFSPNNIAALKKIIKYCRENEIELVFYSAPMPDFRLMLMGNYDEFIVYINELLAESNVPFYDFNLCRAEQLRLGEKDFRDDNHLTGRGAEKFSQLFCDFVSGKKTEKELFCSTYCEKINTAAPKIYGMIMEDKENSQFELLPVSNSSDTVYYSVTAHKGGELGESVIQEKSENRKIVLDMSKIDRLEVRAYDERDNCINIWYY